MRLPPVSEGAPVPRRALPAATLALDLGTAMGWAIRADDGSVASGTETFRQDRWSGGGMRYLRFRHWLGEIAIMTGGIGLVVYEEVRRHAGTDAAHVYGGFLATLTAWCEDRNVAYEAVPVGTIKRFVTGKGNAGKAAVIAAIRARGFNPADDNEADAIALLLWAIRHRAGGVS